LLKIYKIFLHFKQFYVKAYFRNLFNILNGDMTIVGPRPLTEDIFNMYDLKTKKILINTKPGLTGLSSIIFRDEEKIK
jgi:lipopolysaccharide/colanic/teichoic acid biosynthesis glycosyltransferase